jgi:hypothetical protein
MPSIWKDPVGFVGVLALVNVVAFMFQLMSIYEGDGSLLQGAAAAISFFTAAMLMELQHVLTRLQDVERELTRLQDAAGEDEG